MSLIDELPAEIYTKIIYYKALNNYNDTYDDLYEEFKDYINRSIYYATYVILLRDIMIDNNVIKKCLITEKKIIAIFNKKVIYKFKIIKNLTKYANIMNKINGVNISYKKEIITNLYSKITNDINMLIVKIFNYIESDIDTYRDTIKNHYEQRTSHYYWHNHLPDIINKVDNL